jgi:hypothetical protein
MNFTFRIKPIRIFFKTILFSFLGFVVLSMLPFYVQLLFYKIYPRQDKIIDLCPAGQTLSLQDRLSCRWVIPVKYFVRKTVYYSLTSFTVEVPWSEIDPDFFIDPDESVSFWLYPRSSSYDSMLQDKNNNIDKAVLDDNGILWLENTKLFFKGFDGVEVCVHYGGIGRGSRIIIYRPMGDGMTQWIVPIPTEFESNEVQLNYLKNNIYAIDQKLMEFVSQWH